MCWSNYIAIPIVLKKPLRVYKVGIVNTSCSFISRYQNFRYYKSQIMSTVEINPEFERIGYFGELLNYDCFFIYKGYHSYLTKEIAKHKSYGCSVGVFEIPVDATIYVNYKRREVVSTDIRYLGLLEE